MDTPDRAGHGQHHARPDDRRLPRPRHRRPDRRRRPRGRRRRRWPELAEVGIDFDDVAATLEDEGVHSFAKSFDELLEGAHRQGQIARAEAAGRERTGAWDEDRHGRPGEDGRQHDRAAARTAATRSWPSTSAEARQAAAAKGAEPAASLEELAAKLSPPRAAWVMVPAGKPTDDTITELAELFEPGDVIVDGGNSNYKEAAPTAEHLADKGIGFVDAGTSGGVWGLKEGYCLMVGGTKEAVAVVEPAFLTLAPEGGYAHVGPVGAGHFVKMVHNGIEYGLMQAYAEGFEIMQSAEEFSLDLHEIASIWRYGSVVRSWLLELVERATRPEARLRGDRRRSSSTRARAAGPRSRPSTGPCRPRSSPPPSSTASPRATRTPTPTSWWPPCATSSAATPSPWRAGSREWRPRPPGGRVGSRRSSPAATKTPPLVLVIFGASGDLASRKILPALANLADRGRLERRTSRSSGWPAPSGPTRSSASGPPKACPMPGPAWRTMVERFRYVPGEYAATETFDQLKDLLAEADRQYGTAGQPRLLPGHHPRRSSAMVAEALGKEGCNVPGERRRLRPHRGREALRPRPGQRPRPRPGGAQRLRRGADLPDRPLHGQRDGPERAGPALRQRHLRADLEPPLRRAGPDHGGRGARGRAPRRLLRDGGGPARHRPEPRHAGAGPHLDGAARPAWTPTTSATRR